MRERLNLAVISLLALIISYPVRSALVVSGVLVGIVSLLAVLLDLPVEVAAAVYLMLVTGVGCAAGVVDHKITDEFDDSLFH